ncbi:MAG TPA: hypothetical protein VL402_09420 [Xanthobacteraceae bacterium]|jgi:hypothetical protein|nr:hypothetical protein [Xanthobacteraceae bacterium]
MPVEKMDDRVTPQAPGVATRAILYFALGFIAFVAVIMAGLHVYLKASVSGPLITAPREFPQPRLQATPRDDLARFEREQNKVLSGYGWVDQSHGLIHIPIADAMRIVAGRGARAYDGIDQPTASSPASSRPDSSGGSQP